MSEVTKNYNRSLSSYDHLESQVNNVVADKSPTSLNLTKMLKNAWIYVGVFYILFKTIVFEP